MANINPYLNFKDNTEDAFNFYRSVFGGEFSRVVRFKDTNESAKLPPEDQNKLMHIALPIGKENVLMGTDALESVGHTLTTGNNFAISVHGETEEEAVKIFNALSAGGKIVVPFSKQDWGDLFGMFYDKFGIQWMVNYVLAKKA